MVGLLTEHAVKYGLIVSSYVANKPDQTIVPKDFKTEKQQKVTFTIYFTIILLYQ